MNQFRRLSSASWLTDQPYLLLVLAQIFWASNLIIGRWVAGHIPPIAMSCIRWFGAVLFLLPFAWPYLKRDWPTIRHELPLLIVLALAGIAANSVFLFYGLQYTTALNGLLMQSAGPLFVALWALLLFRTPLTTGQTIGIAISLLGVLVIILRGDLGALASITFNKGDLMIVFAIGIFGLYSALLTRRKKTHPLSFIVVVGAAGAIAMAPFAAIETAVGFQLQFDLLTIACLVYVALIPSTGALLCFNRGVELVGPNRAAPFLHLMPVFGSAMAIAFLGEQPMLFHLIGYALVLLGVFVAARSRSEPLTSPAPDE